MWLTITRHDLCFGTGCEIGGCTETARYIKDDRFNRKCCDTCRDWRERWGFWPDDEDWNG